MTSPHRPPAPLARAPEGGALLVLVRHAEVAAAHHGTLYGGAEVPLSAAGLAASAELAERLAQQEFAAVASSPLERALALARRVAELASLPLQVEPGLRELDRGSWTFRSKAELERESPGALRRYAEDPEHGNAPGGERESALRARVLDALDRIAAGHAGRRVLVVAHAHVIRVAMARACGWTPAQSLRHIVPHLGVVELALVPPGPGVVLCAPEQTDPASR
ncbi:MAG TPA: histidine phosphatase family protein [Planctomycetota bacterium]|nr:histidine phosphatase family protein [Planctomycetota bacterium]